MHRFRVAKPPLEIGTSLSHSCQFACDVSHEAGQISLFDSQACRFMKFIIEAFNAKNKLSQSGFVSQSEAAFWVRARRNKLLAQWTCDLTDEDNQTYLKLLLDADFAKVTTTEGENFLLLKIKNDLMGFGVFLSTEQLNQVFEHFELQAWREQQ